jgi:protein TonB
MYAAVRELDRPNRLLQGLILFSLGVHIILFMHIAGIYRSKALNFIELTMSNISKPTTRSIPRPSPRPKTPAMPQEVNRIQVKQVKQIKVDPVNDEFPDGLMEGISIPSVDSSTIGTTDNFRVTDFLGNDVEFGSSKDYLEMIILKIESVKQYPEQARTMQEEGRVTVGFVVNLSGMVKDVRVIEPCRYDSLNRAALEAVNDAAPFPRPPKRFYNRDVPLQINIIFETT